MPTLRARSERYAAAHGCELQVIDGPEVARYCAVLLGATLAVLSIDSGTADSAICGEVVYAGIAAIEAARALKIERYLAVRHVDVPIN